MDLLERAIFLAIGGGIGFILGYIVARLRDIKEELDEVEHIMKDHDRSHGERGAVTIKSANNIVLFLVVAMVAYAAFVSQKASNDVRDAQEQAVAAQMQLADVTECNQEILQDLLKTVNARTTFTGDQARANIELQRAQAKFLGFLLVQPPRPEAERRAALESYFDSLSNYVEVNSRQAERVRAFPYPTVSDYQSCVAKKQEERQNDQR